MLTLQGRLGDRAVQASGDAYFGDPPASDTLERWGLDLEVGGQPGRRQGKRSSPGVAGASVETQPTDVPGLFSVELRVWLWKIRVAPPLASSAWLAPP